MITAFLAAVVLGVLGTVLKLVGSGFWAGLCICFCIGIVAIFIGLNSGSGTIFLWGLGLAGVIALFTGLSNHG